MVNVEETEEQQRERALDATRVKTVVTPEEQARIDAAAAERDRAGA